jgi:hypothetical protein
VEALLLLVEEVGALLDLALVVLEGVLLDAEVAEVAFEEGDVLLLAGWGRGYMMMSAESYS